MSTILLSIVIALAPSNMELAEEALIMACEVLPDSIADNNIQIVMIELLGEHGGGWFVKQTLTSVLCDNGITIIEKTGENDPPEAVLMVRPMELVVEYGDISRPWLVGSKRVERLAICELSATLVDSDQNIVMTARVSGTAEDVVSWSDAGILNGSSEWEWLSAELPEDTSAGILEPLIVTGVVASLVYLFYSSRAE